MLDITLEGINAQAAGPELQPCKGPEPVPLAGYDVLMPVRCSVPGFRFTARGFLFDKDGTLVAFDHWRMVMGERARRLSWGLGLSGPERDRLQAFLAGGETGMGIIHLPRCDAEEATASYLAQLLGEPVANLRALTVRAFREVDEAFPFERHLRPTPQAEERLVEIRRAGGRTAVVTHDTAEAAGRHLAALGWSELVDAVIGLDVCSTRKPAPDPVLVACKTLDISPEEAVMVGDTPTDLLAGKAAGCKVGIGVLTGLGRAEDLSPIADVLLASLAELHVA